MNQMNPVKGLSGSAYMDLISEILLNTLLLAFQSRQGSALPQDEIESQNARMHDLADKLEPEFEGHPVLEALVFFLRAAPAIAAVTVQTPDGVSQDFQRQEGPVFDLALKQRLSQLPEKTRSILTPVVTMLLDGMEAQRSATDETRLRTETLEAIVSSSEGQEDSAGECDCPSCVATRRGITGMMPPSTTPGGVFREICWTDGVSGKVAVVDLPETQTVASSGFLVLDPSVSPESFKEALLGSALPSSLALIVEVPEFMEKMFHRAFLVGTGETPPAGKVLWTMVSPGKDLRMNVAQMVECIPGLRALCLSGSNTQALAEAGN